MSGWPSGVRGGVHFVAGSAPFVSVGWSRPATGTHADINIVAIASDTRPRMRIYHLTVRLIFVPTSFPRDRSHRPAHQFPTNPGTASVRWRAWLPCRWLYWTHPWRGTPGP